MATTILCIRTDIVSHISMHIIEIGENTNHQSIVTNKYLFNKLMPINQYSYEYIQINVSIHIHIPNIRIRVQ